MIDVEEEKYRRFSEAGLLTDNIIMKHLLRINEVYKPSELLYLNDRNDEEYTKHFSKFGIPEAGVFFSGFSAIVVGKVIHKDGDVFYLENDAYPESIAEALHCYASVDAEPFLTGTLLAELHIRFTRKGQTVLVYGYMNGASLEIRKFLSLKKVLPKKSVNATMP